MISKEFQENIESGDVVLVRCALSNDLIIDRTFKKFEEEYKAADEKMNLLVVPYDGGPLEKDPEKWDMEYLNQQKVALIENFSQERIEHLQKVIQKVMPPVGEKEGNSHSAHQKMSGKRTGSKTTIVEKPKKKELVKSYNKNKDRSKGDKKKETEMEFIGDALIIGGIVITTAGIAVAKPLVIGTGIAATGAGVYIKVSSRG